MFENKFYYFCDFLTTEFYREQQSRIARQVWRRSMGHMHGNDCETGSLTEYGREIDKADIPGSDNRHVILTGQGGQSGQERERIRSAV